MERTRSRIVALGFAVAAAAIGCGNVDDDIEAVSSPLTFGSTMYEHLGNCAAGGQSMLCCPFGKAMIGYYPGTVGVYQSETLKCMDVDFESNEIKLDIGTVREVYEQKSPNPGHTGMHVCEFGSVMVGIHASDNHIACRKVRGLPNAKTAERLDLGTLDTGTNPSWMPAGKHMHVCPATRAMDGVHLSKNQWACLTDNFPF
jgi:hypothetical protein